MKIKQIGNYSKYWVSDNGKVFLHNFGKGKEIKEISQIKNKTRGYFYVNLKDNNKRRHFVIVHRLVALAFLLKRNGKEIVNHKDGNKENNDVRNLEWVTDLENRKHAVEKGLMRWGEKHPKSKLKEKEVIEIKKLLKLGRKHREISEMFNVQRSAITKIHLGIRWKHIGTKRIYKKKK